jgi:hypothetical protein
MKKAESRLVPWALAGIIALFHLLGIGMLVSLSLRQRRLTVSLVGGVLFGVVMSGVAIIWAYHYGRARGALEGDPGLRRRLMARRRP